MELFIAQLLQPEIPELSSDSKASLSALTWKDSQTSELEESTDYKILRILWLKHSVNSKSEINVFSIKQSLMENITVHTH